MPGFKIVNFSDIVSHDNMSAEFWMNHDPKKCDICKRTKK